MTKTLEGWHPGLGMLTARRIDGENQIDLAERLTRATGRTWNQAKISRLELGSTEMTAREVYDVARVQGRTYGWYLDGPNPGYLNLISDNPHVARGSSIVNEVLVEDWARTLPITVAQAS